MHILLTNGNNIALGSGFLGVEWSRRGSVSKHAPDAPIDPLIVRFANPDAKPLKILELGCGPVSVMGRKSPDGSPS